VKASPADGLLARVRDARTDPSSPASAQSLRVVLQSRESRAIAKAAAVAAEADLVALRPQLAATLARLLDATAKADPGCAAKQALCEALDRLGHDDEGLFRRAIRHEQWEPVFGGRVDTAVDLRGSAALGLARLDRPDALLDLARLLADREPAARMDAARAIAFRGRPDALPLLHLRIHAGDADPRVLGSCFEAALRLAPVSSLPLVAGFLDGTLEVAEEAALALGASRRPEAFEILREWCSRSFAPGPRAVGFRALALLRREEAFDLLIEQVRNGSPPIACDALAALSVLRDDEGLRTRAREAAAGRDEPAVAKALREAFGLEQGRLER
jgi:hypothetical protein